MVVLTCTRTFTSSEWADLAETFSLSRRQTEVLTQLLQGHSDKQIASALHMSVPTVRTHLTRLFLKFDVQDRCELILHVFGYFCENCREHGCSHFQ